MGDKKIYKLLALSLPLQWLVFKVLSFFPVFVEQFYSLGIYQIISKTVNSLFFWIPFSVGQWMFYSLLFLLGYVLYKSHQAYPIFKNRNFRTLRKFLVLPLSFISIIYLFFNILWGLNYSREHLHTTLNLELNKVENNDLLLLSNKLIDACNKSRKDINVSADTSLELSWKNGAYFSLAISAFENLSYKQSAFEIKRPSVKSVAIPQLMSIAGIGGIYFPFTGEANVNMHQPDFKLPFTICHEMAHQAGFASETEANFIAYLACRESKEPVFNYSGHFSAMRYALNALHRADSNAFNETIVKLDKGVLLDLEANTLYWERFESPIDDFSRWINNIFLKANGQSEGVKSYGLVVDLLVADFKQNTRPVSKSHSSKEVKPTANSFSEQFKTITHLQLPCKLSIADLERYSISERKMKVEEYEVIAVLRENPEGIYVIALNEDNNTFYVISIGQSNKILDAQHLYTPNNYANKIHKLAVVIEDDLSITKSLSTITCHKINDSLTICDTVTNTDQFLFNQDNTLQ